MEDQLQETPSLKNDQSSDQILFQNWTQPQLAEAKDEDALFFSSTFDDNKTTES